uniref:Pre-mRNA-splicing factor SLU7 n=1 Tax=Chromera velia CCMP2878 TaxID=1169474 RepID=A0A0G4HBE4_9ALVE|mmetsp:Transcript_39056/g.76831  ORF Transcript_39056/g.76831 Transcript_39056/m.76831 type:complete len:586 (-) Transcript_39056:447-2204(-)|eukprot:Cvel_25941.t1-p1 / transcript=Cvel_25941.t1 / gene=Cvel_25941 / organism=Chromera_velia_CCMP2878 / gene_product=Pre-mRNA-splicing factor SLU7, putative / transcript_product=Pre-mRNA-splicing factor SLU7, putative / location=Cvel_scaffold3005:692-5239(-) / protein_length=585 / sequence_SO=supercontig / SO=protein_coding / is_pseudo=false
MAEFASRDELKAQKALEEARKAGTAPPEKDADGKDINPHIPQFISKAPWYLSQGDASGSGLKHQRYKADKLSGLLGDQPILKGVTEQRASKFRKGACENCGAMTHKTKDCVERPRAKGAKWSGRDFAPDEYIVPDRDADFDSKRDRYHNYDPAEYQGIIDDYEAAEVERKRRKQEELSKHLQSKLAATQSKRKRRKIKERLSKLEGADEAARVEAMEQMEEEEKAKERERELREKEGEKSDGGNSGGSEDSDSDSEAGGSDSEDEDLKIRDFDKRSAPMGSRDARTKTTTRNLRIREDTAKYLHNLDVNSAFYDPKTRSMRANPFMGFKEDEAGMYRGDNAYKGLGDSTAMTDQQVFAWEAYKRGQNVHFNAQPTQLEYMFKEYQKKKEELANEKTKELLAKYGGEEHLEAPKSLIFSQTEAYTEYGRDGTVVGGRGRQMVSSKYEEDVHPGNHTSVWGSWYDVAGGKWGFACCRQTRRDADCTSAALLASAAAAAAASSSSSSSSSSSAAAAAAAAAAAGGGSAASSSSSSSSMKNGKRTAGGDEEEETEGRDAKRSRQVDIEEDPSGAGGGSEADGEGERDSA